MKKMLLIALALLFCSSALADEGRLAVSGSGTVYLEADQVSATLGVMLSGKDLSKVQAEVNETVARVCEALESAGLEEKNITTNYIYVNPRYDYGSSRSDEQELVGYTVNNSLLIITTDTDAIGRYIDIAFEAGANTFDSIRFSVQDDREARDKALELAVQDACRKAEVIAAASNRNIEGILEINEGSMNTSYNGASASDKLWTYTEAAAASVDTTVRAAQVSVNANVQIIFEIK